MISDLVRMQTTLKERDLDASHACVSGVFTMHNIMLGIAYEWVLRWLAFASERSPQSLEPGRKVFLESLNADEGEMGHAIDALVSPDFEMPGESARFLAAFPWLAQSTETVLGPARAGQWDHSHAECERLFRLHRLLHDLLFRHSWALMSQVTMFSGQPLAEEGLRRALTESSFYDMQWKLTEGKSPREISQMLIEHMRSHFSGPDGDGHLRVEEDDDSILLVFEPCGSGGAMRRRLDGKAAGFVKFPNASTMTWGRAGEVPAYCAHCTINEHEAVKRRGHLVWATEFDPDPQKPCGWRVFKDPDKIPRRYYERLGL